MEKILYHASFRVEMGCGIDLWRICGEHNGKTLWIGTPVKILETDSENDSVTVENISVSVYIMYGPFSENFKKDLQEVIDNKGFKAI